MIYLSSIIFFGLLEIWILVCFLLFKEVQYSYPDLIRGGTLFFFSSSLAVTTYVHHMKVFKRARPNEPYWSFFSAFVIIALCFVGFVSAIEVDSAKKSFEIVLTPTQNLAQVVSSISAIFYGFAIEKRVKIAIK